MIKAYFRCNGGDYFDGDACPFDGWSSDELREFHAALQRLNGAGKSPSISALQMQGLSATALSRVIVIDFGDDAASFDALSPSKYLKDGIERKLGNLGKELT
jgi:hypothetical protein